MKKEKALSTLTSLEVFQNCFVRLKTATIVAEDGGDPHNGTIFAKNPDGKDFILDFEQRFAGLFRTLEIFVKGEATITIMSYLSRLDVEIYSEGRTIKGKDAYDLLKKYLNQLPQLEPNRAEAIHAMNLRNDPRHSMGVEGKTFPSERRKYKLVVEE